MSTPHFMYLLFFFWICTLIRFVFLSQVSQGWQENYNFGTSTKKSVKNDQFVTYTSSSLLSPIKYTYINTYTHTIIHIYTYIHKTYINQFIYIDTILYIDTHTLRHTH